MPLSSISSGRPLTSYAKVQAIVGRLIRNRSFQLGRARVKHGTYLDLGCGPNTHEEFINLDYLWHPQVDVCWDIRRGLPFASGSFTGVFSEHCLEHFSLLPALSLLREIRRVLAPAGMLRLVVPDGELYLRTYASQLDGESHGKFPFQAAEITDPLWTPISSVNRVFYQDRDSHFGHRTMFDFRSLATLLQHCGFAQIDRCQFGEGRDPRLLIDTPSRRPESLYVEASAPA